MALTYPAIADVDPERLARLKELFAAAVQDLNPSLDLRRGLVHDNVLHARALLAAVSEEAVVNALLATSLAELVADPTLGDEDAVDRALGNYRMTRLPAAPAVGEVAVVVEELVGTVVPGGTAVTISGQAFTVDRSYSARTSEDQVVGPGDTLMREVTGGYLFTIGVEADDDGTAGNVRYGATASLGASPPGFVRAFAAADFTGGADAETNAALLGRWSAGLACRGWSNRPSIEAAMRDHAEEDEDGDTVRPFERIKAVSVVGYGDAEMTRDRHALWPVSGGARADLYLRSEDSYATVRVTKTAALVSKVGALGTWQVGLGRDDAPGFYEILKVLLPDADPSAAGFTVTSEVRGTDLTGDDWKPDVPTTAEGAYSRYQTAVLQFEDTETNATALSVGATAEYDVLVSAMPLVGDVQDFWNDLSRRPTSGDVLVKAPVPCFTSVSLTMQVSQGTEVDEDEAKQTVATAVAAAGFSGRVAASAIGQTLHAAYPGLVTVSGVSFVGRVRKPSGAEVVITGTDDLVVVPDPDENVGARTVAFLTAADDVSVSVVTLSTPGA